MVSATCVRAALRYRAANSDNSSRQRSGVHGHANAKRHAENFGDRSGSRVRDMGIGSVEKKAVISEVDKQRRLKFIKEVHLVRKETEHYCYQVRFCLGCKARRALLSAAELTYKRNWSILDNLNLQIMNNGNNSPIHLLKRELAKRGVL